MALQPVDEPERTDIRDALALDLALRKPLDHGDGLLVAKGVLGPGAFETADCRQTFAELDERGVTFLSEPTERFYGVEATFRDNSGNWFSMTERNSAYAGREDAPAPAQR